MKVEVALQHCTSYDRTQVESAVEALLHHLGGIRRFVKAGQTVLLKPNSLSGSTPEKHVTTHPELVRAVARRAKAIGARVQIGDSPGIGAFRALAVPTGYAAVADDLGIELVSFDDIETVQSSKGYALQIGKPVVDADVIINMPKLKTHCQMFLTLGVKNCFGCVPGGRKAQWHFRAGIHSGTFANVLVNIYNAVKPQLTIMDAIWGMERNGPGNGKPRPVGWLAGSADAVALDRVVVDLLGFRAEQLPVLREAELEQAGQTDLAQIAIRGTDPADCRISDFRPPDHATSLLFERLPALLRRPFREFLTSKPVLTGKSCIECGRCYQACPAGAIEWQPMQRPRFVYKKCIRCFCCQEMCENNAIRIQEGYGLRAMQPFRKLLLRRWGL